MMARYARVLSQQSISLRVSLGIRSGCDSPLLRVERFSLYVMYVSRRLYISGGAVKPPRRYGGDGVLLGHLVLASVGALMSDLTA